VEKSEQDFLKELQKQCVSDSTEYTAAAYEALMGLTKNPPETLSKIMKCFHSVKGNVQAVGFNFMGDFVHEVEETLISVSQKLGDIDVLAGGEKDLLDLEFWLSKVIQATDEYFKDLSETSVDCEEFLECRRGTLALLASWTPNTSQSTAGNEGEAPVTEIAVPQWEATVAPTEPAPQAKTGKGVYLLCRNRDREYAIPVLNVVEVVKFRNLSLIPCERGDLMGLMNLRGEVMPILDLSRTFGGQENPERCFIVICEVKGTRFGFPIENAEHIEELNFEYFQKGQDLSSSDERSLINHIYVKGNKTVFVVDVEWILAS